MLTLPSYAGYPQGYPQSSLGYGAASNEVHLNAAVDPAIDIAQAPVRQTARIKIESPSVIAAAKKATVETINVASPEAPSSATSDEDTLIGKSKSSKSCSGDISLSPTKSKL